MEFNTLSAFSENDFDEMSKSAQNQRKLTDDELWQAICDVSNMSFEKSSVKVEEKLATPEPPNYMMFYNENLSDCRLRVA